MLKKTDDNLVIGVDFGTSGVRAVVVDTADGSEQATSTAGFPRWNRGDYCDPALAQYRQHPQELIEAFKAAVTDAVNQLTAEPSRSITNWVSTRPAPGAAGTLAPNEGAATAATTP